jgi:TRAP-type C4-dicarboxylate transport system substrate-binding protein
LQPWMDAVKASSNGRIDFAVRDNNTLVKESQQVDALLAGTSDLCAFQSDWVPGVFPLLELGGMPMVYADTAVAAKVVWQLIQEYGQDEFKDFKILGILMIYPSEWGGIKPVRVPTDLKGLRVRSGGGTETQILEALGATAVEIDTSDVQISAQRGMFDGAFLSWMYQGFFLKDWATNFSEVNMACRPLLLAMNKQKWESLPAAVQKAFEDNSGLEASLEYLAQDGAYQLDNAAVPSLPQRGWDRKLCQSIAAAKGTDFVTLTADEREQWVTALTPVYQTWIDDYASELPTQEIMDKVKELAAQYAGGSAAPAGATTTSAQ